MMALGPRGEALIKSFETLAFSAYQKKLADGTLDCWTIGWGHTGPEVHQGLMWTPAQCQEAFAKDTHAAVSAVLHLVDIALTQPQFDALVSFTFNLGAPALEHSTLLRLVNAGHIEAAAQQFVRWDHEGSVEVAGLLRRREAERDLFLAP